MTVHPRTSQAYSATNITLRRRHATVLNGTSLIVNAGEVLSLLGANGAGKSTFLSVLAGEVEPDDGARTGAQISLNGTSLSALSAPSRARSRSVLPQKPALSFDLDVAEVVAMGAYPFPDMAAADAAVLSRHALQQADALHLHDRRYPELSGGEQQRVQFARVLVQILAMRHVDMDGRYLLLDEPTASLDPFHQQTLLKVVRELAVVQRIGVLLVLHDVNLAACWSDRIALLSEGTIFACDTPAAVLTAENLHKVYGVHVYVMPHPTQTERPLVVF